MQGLVFDPTGYYDDKLKRRDKKKQGHIQSINPKLQRSISSKSSHSTPTSPPSHKHQRSLSSHFNKSCSSLLVDSTRQMYQPTTLKTSLSHSNGNSNISSPKSDCSNNSNNSNHKSKRHKRRHHNGKSHTRKRSGSGSSTRSTHSNHSRKSSKEKSKQTQSKVPKQTDELLENYKKHLLRKKLRRTRSLNSNGANKLLNIEKVRITKDKFSRLFHDFESTKSLIDKSERDQFFRSKLRKLNEKKQKNKAIAYELIRQYFDSILEKKHSNHPLALLITKFCNLFHGQYSFSPQDFKNKSIYQIVDQKRLKRRGNKRSTSDIFDDSSNGIKNQSKVIRKTSRRLDKATEDVKQFINKLRSLIITLYPELKVLRTYKYVVQSVFHKELFQQLTPTLGDLYSIKTEDKQSEFAKYMGMWKNLACRDYGVNDKFIEFCLIPSIRPLLLSEQNNNEKEGNINETNEAKEEEEEDTNDIQIEPEPGVETETIETHDSENKPMSGLGKQLADHNDIIESYGNDSEQEEEKQHEIIHNAEPSDITLTEQTLKDFDENYAITVLGGNGIDTLNNENINTNFTRPEYINEYNMELDYDDETFVDILSSGSSYRKSPNPSNMNDINMRQRERELNNMLNISSPTISSISSMDGIYELNDITDIHSSPDSSLTYASTQINKTSVSVINSNELPRKINSINPKIICNKPEKPKSRFGSFLGVFGKGKKKKKNISTCDMKIGISNKYEVMNTATKIIEQGIQNNQRKTPQQFLTPMSNKNKQRGIRRPTALISPMKTPKISITPQNEHQENHPTPPSKRINNKNKTNKIQLKENINNITKQMLAGSHAAKISNKLHNKLNNNNNIEPNKSEIETNIKSINSIETNNKKSIKVIEKKEITKLDAIEEKENMNEPFIESEEDRGHNPYLAAVLEIRKMQTYDTPEDKIQCVVRTADIIRDCIDKYYENRRKDPVQITPDDLLSLFAYILVQANLHSLWAEIDLIDDFVVDNLRMDMPGYYIATLRAAMQLIVNDIERLTDKSTKKRNSTIKQDNL